MNTSPLPSHLPGLLPKMWRFALRLTQHHQDAQDLVQRTCVRALEREHQWNREGSPLSWLYAILHSIWLNEMRSRRLHPVDSLSTDDDEEDQPLEDERAESLMFFRQVVLAVDGLPEAQRVVMLLVAVEGLSYREAADVIGVPIGTVMSRLARARAAIGARFSDSPSVGKFNVA
jgi:RNA polymerase sigma-70 factor, ECF subfamily